MLRSWRTVTGARATLTLLVSLLVTSLLLHHSGDPYRILERLSTNVANLTRAPIRSLVGSALVLPDGGLLFYSVALAVTLGVLELRLGMARAISIFVSGHLTATLLTEGGVWIGIRDGLLPAGERRQIDVGVSYGLMACTGAVIALAPRRLRLPLVVMVAGWTLESLVSDPDMTSAGHAIALLVGLAWWPVLDAGCFGGWRSWVELRFARVQGGSGESGRRNRGHRPGRRRVPGRPPHDRSGSRPNSGPGRAGPHAYPELVAVGQPGGGQPERNRDRTSVGHPNGDDVGR
jgi:hypothetical protein